MGEAAAGREGRALALPVLRRGIAGALLLGGALLSLPAGAADPAACRAGARRPPGDTRIAAAIDEAHRQHQLFGGQAIERNGGMFRVGYHEAEWDRPPGEALGTWQRVATFWRALSESEPPRVLTSQGWVWRSQAGDANRADVATREALLRASIVDTPWSAAFISYLMKTAGFSASEFAFSDSHVDYVQAAMEASQAEAAGRESPYAYRACDVATTRPRAGDLLCATRASTAGVADFSALAAALASRPPGVAFPMHCELVVRADEGGDAKLDTIGGNVVQSVTLSHMTLNARKVLGDTYIARGAPPAGCARAGATCRERLTRRPWVAVLQFRR
jgi:hypothetical protein